MGNGAVASNVPYNIRSARDKHSLSSDPKKSECVLLNIVKALALQKTAYVSSAQTRREIVLYFFTFAFMKWRVHTKKRREGVQIEGASSPQPTFPPD